MNRCSDFIMTEGGQRVGHHLHRVSIIDTSCAPEGGIDHQPALAKPSRVFRDDAPSFLFGALASLAIVALCCAVALVGFTMALPKKPSPELPRATEKVTT